MKTALCLGTFDGLHKGHRAVLNLPSDYKKIAVTFKTPPKASKQNEPMLIMSLEDKCKALYKCGIDEIHLLDFDKVKDISPFEFLQFLKKEFSPSLISCGFNYRFGKGGEGDAIYLAAFCEENNIEFKCVQSVNLNGNSVSSTVIRETIKNGEVEKANKLLFEPFSFETEVLQGDKRGRTIGFPTINQKYPTETVRLKFGVYKTKVSFRGKEFDGITNIGIRPTYKSDYVISETYIKNFSGDLYGENVKITPVKFLREEKKFNSIEELKKQIEKDLES